MSSLDACPVCRRQDFEDSVVSGNVLLIECPSCGSFAVSYSDCANLINPQLRTAQPGWNFLHVSALLREQSTQPLPPFWLRYGNGPYIPIDKFAPIDLQELLRRWPRSVPERIDRSLCNLAALSKRGGSQVDLKGSKGVALLFAESEGEAEFNLRALVEKGLLKSQPGQPLRFPVELTPKGWEYFEKLKGSAPSPHNPAFVAMWFGEAEEEAAMDAAFKTAIRPAIERAGYRADRVDLVEHNDFIMDKVLGGIRQAPFVVADFTGQRNGVYFEAGFARGLGIPVIHTCRADWFDRAHFDTKQLNHIVWTKPDELQEGLYHRILGTIGRGPFKAGAGQ